MDVGESAGGCNADALAGPETALDGFEGDDAIGQSEQSVIFALANIQARKDGSAALTNQDRTCSDGFAAIGLNAKALGIGIASVPC